MLGNHLPRRCGIATFTTDLMSAIHEERPDIGSVVVAMNDVGQRHAYPGRVRFEIDEGDVPAYRRAADFLNVNAVDVLSVQHEYGIFGGKAGSHLLPMLRELRMPIVTTLHTILATPDAAQRGVMDELVRLSERLVVMSETGRELLRKVHGVPDAKIDLIPHGIPDLPVTTGSKDKLGVEGRSVILTFGLLSPDKGIEHVIDALPAIVARRPDAVYIVLGATHPHVKERHGESYRRMLEASAAKLGVGANIIFHDRFVSHGELVEFLAAADIYVTPYLKEEQITSGTLAYAVGSGKAVVSTPYHYARELLADGRGVLVPWRSSSAIADEIVGLLENDDRRREMQQRAFEFGRRMRWPVVARAYLASFERARQERRDRLHTSFEAKTLAARAAELPEIDLSHLRLMTDDTGIIQHASFAVPRYSDGYCLDDNARALLLTVLLEETGTQPRRTMRELASRYLAFVNYAFDPDRGRFRNFMSFGRVWLEDVGSEDSHARAVWALGTVVGRSSDPGRQSLARALFHAALPQLAEFTSPRAWAYALLGIEEYLRAFHGDTSVQAIRARLAGALIDVYRRTRRDNWPWFEDRLTYCNARLSQALIVSGARMDDAEMVAAGVRSLEWLVDVQTGDDGRFAPIGSNRPYVRGGATVEFDQQPVDVYATISACLDARRVTGHERWTELARRQFSWFLGQNRLERPLYDAASGGCCDGLHPDRRNENQGAESTLSFLMALSEMRLAADEFVPTEPRRELGRALEIERRA